MKQRFQFSNESNAGMVELHPAAVLKAGAWRPILEGVSGVQRVILQPKGSKTEQMNTGKHYQDHNFFVYPTLYPNQPLEFELTRSSHQEDTRNDFSITAMFKDTGAAHPEMALEAWRILREAVRGRELLPAWVEDYHNRQRTRLTAALEGSASTMSMEPSSASSKGQEPD